MTDKQARLIAAVKDRLHILHMTQKCAAWKAGISKGTLYNVLAGTHDMSEVKWRMLCEGLELDYDEIVAEYPVLEGNPLSQASPDSSPRGRAKEGRADDRDFASEGGLEERKPFAPDEKWVRILPEDEHPQSASLTAPSQAKEPLWEPPNYLTNPSQAKEPLGLSYALKGVVPVRKEDIGEVALVIAEKEAEEVDVLAAQIDPEPEITSEEQVKEAERAAWDSQKTLIEVLTMERDALLHQVDQMKAGVSEVEKRIRQMTLVARDREVLITKLKAMLFDRDHPEIEGGMGNDDADVDCEWAGMRVGCLRDR